MAENKNDNIIDFPTRNSIDRVMNSKPTSLADAVRMDINALLPQSDVAIERRQRVRRVGRNFLIALGIAAPTALFGAMAADNLLPAHEVGSTVVVQDQGEGLLAPIQEGLAIISDESGINVRGADARTAVTDLANEGVDSQGYAGLPIEVTASTSAIFGNARVEATSNISTNTLPKEKTEEFPPALPLDTED